MNKNKNFLREAKSGGKKLATLTAYDYPTARLLDDCGLDFILVGDSLGMVVLGYPDTVQVTMADMIHHTKAVARGVEKTWIVADLPFGTYADCASAVIHSRQLIEAGADAVKLEGGLECLDQVRAIIAEGIPMVGHLGMLPQQVRVEGGYHVKGREDEEASIIWESALALDQAGVSAIVMELVHKPVASQIAKSMKVPIIGIGSGLDCDGQILVFHDLVGLFPWFRPKFAKARAEVAEDIRSAVGDFVRNCRLGG